MGSGKATIEDWGHPDAPPIYKVGRRCVKCRAKVSRYTKPYLGGYVLCGLCERKRVDLDLQLHQFADVPKSGRTNNYELPRLGKVRRAKGLRQPDLAREVECATSTIKAVEQGQLKASTKLAGKLARALEVDVSELRGLE